MCGIAGVFDPEAATPADRLAHFAATMARTRNAVAWACIRNRLKAPMTPAKPANPTATWL